MHISLNLLHALKVAHKRGLVISATSLGDQFPSCELPIFVKKSSRSDQILAPATSPTNSNWLNSWGKSQGLVP